MVEVTNVIDPEGEIVFICESPHIDEVFHGYPLAGESGRNISKCLINRYDVPIGLIASIPAIKELLGLTDIKKFSLVNISKIPLQSKVYHRLGVDAPPNIQDLEKIKIILEKGDATLDTVHRRSELNKLKKGLYSNFKLECQKHLSNHTLIVPCGSFSEAFCRKLQKEKALPTLRFLYGLPHPIKGWDRVEERLLKEVFLRPITET